jgi:hypothetical protein
MHAQPAADELHEDQLLNFLVNAFEQEVALDIGNNAEVDAADIYDVLVGACADWTSISILCENSDDAPHENTVLYHLREKLELT